MDETTLPAAERDVLVLAKTIAANEFPVERPSVIGADRETGRLVRLAPFPWRGNDSDPPVARWSWIHVATEPDERDVRPETQLPEGGVTTTAYVEPGSAWRFRLPFVRPYLVGSVDSFMSLARDRAASAGFVRVAEGDVIQLPLRYAFRCASDECTATHELPILDWELHEMARLSRERFGAQWATRFRASWGAGLVERFDVHLLLSGYAQAPTKLYIAAVVAVPREAEDEHAHAHHLEHRKHE